MSFAPQEPLRPGDASRALERAHAFLDTFSGDQRSLLKELQRLLSCSPSADHEAEFDSFCFRLWNFPQLLDDCIIVTGIHCVRLKNGRAAALLAEHRDAGFAHWDWVQVALIRGGLISGHEDTDLVDRTLVGIEDALQQSRFVLLSRNLENLTMALEAAAAPVTLDLLDIVSRCLRLNSDLVEHKVRDLVNQRLRRIKEQESHAEQVAFVEQLVLVLPERNKFRLQLLHSLLVDGRLPERLAELAFEDSLKMLSVKGLTALASDCIALVLDARLDLAPRLADVLVQIGSSSELGMLGFSLSERLSPDARTRVLQLLEGTLAFEAISLCFNVDKLSELEVYLSSADEFVARTAFECLCRTVPSSRVQKRKPTEPVSSQDCRLFSNFVFGCAFSASVQLRKSVLATSRHFYDQIFSRLYSLARNASESELTEYVGHLGWLERFSKLLLQGELAQLPFGTAEHLLTQLLAVLSAKDKMLGMAGGREAALSKVAKDLGAVFEFANSSEYRRKLTDFVRESSFDSLRVLVIQIANRCKWDELAVDNDAVCALLRHSRTTKNEAAARLVELQFLLLSPAQRAVKLAEYIKQLSDGFGLLRSSFLDQLRECSFNGLLVLLRFLMHDSEIAMEAGAVEGLLRTVVEIGQFVSGVASHPSPEGLDLQRQLSALGLEDEDDEEEEEEEEEAAVYDDNGQRVLAFSWRAIKESCSLIEAILERYASSIDRTTWTLVIEHMTALILRLRHRGAFSSIQGPLSSALRLGLGFEEKCDRLREILRVCLETGEISTTRRSAGLPHAVLAVLHSCQCKSSDLRPIAEMAVSPLLLCIETLLPGAGASSQPSLIHSFNIMRVLVKDSRVADVIAPFIARTVRVCLEGFSSLDWNVRNGSAMLLSALIIRIFGSCYLNDEESERSFLDVRELEAKFPGLVQVVEGQLEKASVDDELDPRVAYPLLAIIQRMRIPKLERFAGIQRLAFEYLFGLLLKLSRKPECGRKLAHVVGRAFDRLEAREFVLARIAPLLEDAGADVNKRANCRIVLEHCNLVQRDEQLGRGLCAAADAIRTLEDELQAPFVRFESIGSLLRQCVAESIKVPRPILCTILDRYRLNESIAGPALRLLCRTRLLDDALKTALHFYSGCESNENLRWIAVSALAELERGQLAGIAQIILALLFDDDEDLRRAACGLLGSLRLAETVRAFITEIDCKELELFSERRKMCSESVLDEDATVLFEREPLNGFCSLEWLLEHEML